MGDERSCAGVGGGPARRASVNRRALWVEFIILFLGVPILVATKLEGGDPLTTLWILTALALILLHLTPGFRWPLLLRRITGEGWRICGAALLVATAWCVALGWMFAPDRLGALLWRDPLVWLAILLLYPALSALPQEIIYRTLFFERYATLIPGRWTLIVVNGALFAFGHLFIGHPVTYFVTGVAGAVIAWTYQRTRSLALAVVLHGVAGVIAVTCGLGPFLLNAG